MGVRMHTGTTLSVNNQAVLTICFSLVVKAQLPLAEAIALLINGVDHSPEHWLSTLLALNTTGLARHVTCAPSL